MPSVAAKYRGPASQPLCSTVRCAFLCIAVGCVALIYFAAVGRTSSASAHDGAVRAVRKAAGGGVRAVAEAASSVFAAFEADVPSAEPECDHPPSSALKNAFATESFRLEKIVQRPGSDEWRLCYPGRVLAPGEHNPNCPASSFFIVNQRDSSTDGVVDWLQGYVYV